MKRRAGQSRRTSVAAVWRCRQVRGRDVEPPARSRSGMRANSARNRFGEARNWTSSCAPLSACRRLVSRDLARHAAPAPTALNGFLLPIEIDDRVCATPTSSAERADRRGGDRGLARTSRQRPTNVPAARPLRGARPPDTQHQARSLAAEHVGTTSALQREQQVACHIGYHSASRSSSCCLCSASIRCSIAPRASR